MTCTETTLEAECTHNWTVDEDSFSHEFGTEFLACQRCLTCDAVSDYAPPKFNDCYYPDNGR